MDEVRPDHARMIDARYSLDREIGRGGTGAVWLGRDEVLGRPVALKRLGLLPGADQPDTERADREARLSARITHPHVVAVFDVVTEEATGDRWLVMEHVDGSDLARLVHENGPLTPDAAAPILWQAADALAAAHAEGLTHRDVKPSNVLVDEHGQAKLTDFGIARLSADPSLTQTGMMTGSPAYLAPEVARGGRGEPASDVWSLGATAFHVLTGRPPYEVADHVLGVLYRIVNDEPPRLPTAGWMAPLLEGTMVKDPERRWSMEQVREFLARPYRAALPVTTATSPDATSSTATSRVPVSPEPVVEEHTRMLGAVGALPVTPTSADASAFSGESARSTRSRPPVAVLAGLATAAVLVLVAVLALALSRGGPEREARATAPDAATGSAAPASVRPTAQGMEAFIRDYVATVAEDPDRSWSMLTAKFQRESGGLERYRAFWDSATNGTVRDIEADPETLTVSYHVHFDDFDNGPGPTVLDLVFRDGRYLIDGERSKGFVPAD